MMVSPGFQKSINEEDILMVRIMLKDSLIMDPTFVRFSQMLELAEKSLRNLYDEHDEEELSSDISKWTKDYMDEQMVKVVDNFSIERLDLLKNICRHLYRDRLQEIEKKRREQTNSSCKINKRQVGAGVTVGGAVAIVAGVAISKPVIIGAGVAAAVAGGVLIATDR